MNSGSQGFIDYGKILRKIDLDNRQCTHYITSVMPYWGAKDDTVSLEGKIWQKANTEVNIDIQEERSLSGKEWQKMNFPFFGIPEGPQTHVNCQEWKFKLQEMDSLGKTTP